jgi:hypothetical protein
VGCGWVRGFGRCQRVSNPYMGGWGSRNRSSCGVAAGRAAGFRPKERKTPPDGGGAGGLHSGERTYGRA